MPEGDTIFRSARSLERALCGSPVRSVSTTVGRIQSLGPQRLIGQHVQRVEARGKHLLLWFAPSGMALHSHMRMTGSWHTYRPGQRWRKPAHLARIVLETDQAVAVCFAAPTIELLSAAQVRRHPGLAALGPDALDEAVDLAEARRRLDRTPDRPVVEALLDQQVLAGVGNVYANEVLFMAGVHPWATVAAVPGAVRDQLLATAVALLRANAAAPSATRATTPWALDQLARGGRRPRDPLHVYGRAGRGCLRCHTPIRVGRAGPLRRVTYWCPQCQPPPVA